MKPVTIILVVAVVVLGGYFILNSPDTAPAPEAGQAATDAPAEQPADDAAAASDGAASSDAGTSAEAEQPAADSSSTDSAAADSGSSDSATTDTASTDTGTAASDDSAAVADGSGDLSGLLTADGFDYDKVIEAINGSSLDEAKKTMLNTAVTQAKDNPELLQAALDQVKSALGM